MLVIDSVLYPSRNNLPGTHFWADLMEMNKSDTSVCIVLLSLISSRFVQEKKSLPGWTVSVLRVFLRLSEEENENSRVEF